MRGAAAAGADGDGRRIEPVVELFDQRRDKVLADFDGMLDAMLSVQPGRGTQAGARGLEGEKMEPGRPSCRGLQGFSLQVSRGWGRGSRRAIGAGAARHGVWPHLSPL